jgi:type I restriction enzyme M protein
VSAEEIRKRAYNLDVRNPNAENESHRDPDELLAEYRALLAEVEETRETLKRELGAALGKALVAEVEA